MLIEFRRLDGHALCCLPWHEQSKDVSEILGVVVQAYYGTRARRILQLGRLWQGQHLNENRRVFREDTAVHSELD